MELVGRSLGYEPDEMWDILYGRKPRPKGWVESWAEAFQPLTSVSIRTKDRYNMQAPLTRDRKTLVGRPMENDHPFAQWLRDRGMTLTDWAFRNGYKRERVKSWIADGSGARPIPRDAADLIEKQAKAKGSKLPATLVTWPNGIRE